MLQNHTRPYLLFLEEPFRRPYCTTEADAVDILKLLRDQS